MGARSGILVWAVAALVAAGVLAPSTAGLWHRHGPAHAHFPSHDPHAGLACSHGHAHDSHDHSPAEESEPAPAEHPDHSDGPCTICVLLGQPMTEASAPAPAAWAAACSGVVDEATPGDPGMVRWPAALARGPPPLHG